jgi:hypothetical protein
MKKGISVFSYMLMVLVVISTFGCGGGGGGDSSSSTTTPTQPSQPVTPGGTNVSDKGIVMGKITNDAGTVVGTVSLQLDSTTVTSNEQGFFSIDGVLPAGGKVLKYSKTGYMPGYKRIDVVAGQQTFCNLTLKKIGHSEPVNGAVQNPVTVTDTRTDGRNGSVFIPANSVVDASGRPVSSFTAEITTLLPSDSNYTNIFPGSFMGGSSPGSTANPQPLISYGVVNVDLKDAQGNKLFLASGRTATITFPVDQNNDPGTPAIPLWYLDEASGVWIQEGEATLTGNAYVGQVSHLTPWNCDELLTNPVYKQVTVKDVDGNAVYHAYVVIEGTGYRQVGYTSDVGTVQITVRAWDTIRVWAEKGTLKSQVRTEMAGDRGTTFQNSIVLAAPLVSVTLSWGFNPSDLDSHMTGPTAGGGRFHVYYSSKGGLGAAPYCNLDTDDRTSYGPEIITVTKLYQGVYRYSVHNYSGQATFRMENSGATVNLIAPGGIIRLYTVPASNPTNGNTWVVFELTVDAQGGVTVTDINNFVTTDPSGGGVTEIEGR